MFKKVLKFVAILVLGGIGGFLYQAFLLPYLATNPYFGKFKFIKDFKERQTIVYPKEVVIIRENSALEDAVDKVGKTVVGIKASKKNGQTIEGSGLILTSDGLLITLNSLLPAGYIFNVFLDGETVPFQVLKRDPNQNLALIKIEKNNLQTTGFADFGKIEIGERIFLVGALFEKAGLKKTVNEGVVKNFNESLIKTNIIEETNLAGSSLFDIEGNLLGINTVDKLGRVSAIPLNKIREFSGL
jgi:S1-C subfamily serine protease